MTEEQDRTLQALKTAIQMEIDGKAFYLKASQASGNELGRKLLQSLSKEEDLHRQKFESIYGSISKQKGWPKTDYEPDGGRGLRTLFARALEAEKPDMQTSSSEMDDIQKAMDMENQTYDFYISLGKKATYDAEKDFFEAVASQEKEHHRILLDYYEFLKDPAAWYVQKEHPSLDGG